MTDPRPAPIVDHPQAPVEAVIEDIAITAGCGVAVLTARVDGVRWRYHRDRDDFACDPEAFWVEVDGAWHRQDLPDGDVVRRALQDLSDVVDRRLDAAVSDAVAGLRAELGATTHRVAPFADVAGATLSQLLADADAVGDGLAGDAGDGR